MVRRNGSSFTRPHVRSCRPTDMMFCAKQDRDPWTSAANQSLSLTQLITMLRHSSVLRHVFLLLCLSHSLVKAFSPLPSVRVAHPSSITKQFRSSPSQLLAPTPSSAITRNCRRRHSSSTRLQLTPSASLSWWYMSLLALQFGCQPILTKKFTPKTITRSTVVLFQDVVKFTVAAIFLWASGGWSASLTGMNIFR